MARVLPPDLASLDVLNRQCHRRALPACAFLARVLRIARASLDRVLSKTAAASLRSYSWGSYDPCFTVEGAVVGRNLLKFRAALMYSLGRS